MFNKGKKLIAVITAAICMLPFANCKRFNSSESLVTPLEVVKGLPDYSADEYTKKVHIGGFCAPYAAGTVNVTDPETDETYPNPNLITLEQYQQIADCDIDYILTLYDQGTKSENVKKALNYAQQAGVKILVRWDEIINMNNATPQAMKEAIGEDVLEMDSFWGIFAKDEPGANLFKQLGEANEVYKQITDKYFYVNLFPNYASVSYLQTDTYVEYLNKYCHYVDNGMILEDSYPFGHLEGTDKYTISSVFLSNLEIMEELANAQAREHWEYMQGEWTHVGAKIPDYYDMRLQAYLNMCYGVENMQYFCYCSPFGAMDHLSAFIDGSGNKTERWYAGQKINREIHAFDHVYMNFVDNYTKVMPIVGTESPKAYNSAFDILKYARTSHERITSVTAEQDTVIGTYKDGDGRDGFMIVNYTAPGLRLNNKVEINFREADSVVYYREGKYNLVDLSNGKFEIDLEPGEGVFAIPVKY